MVWFSLRGLEGYEGNGEGGDIAEIMSGIGEEPHRIGDESEDPLYDYVGEVKSYTDFESSVEVAVGVGGYMGMMMVAVAVVMAMFVIV